MVEPRISGQLGQVKIESNGQGLVWLAKFFLKVFFLFKGVFGKQLFTLVFGCFITKKNGFLQNKA
jgi:hypothetical protein